MPNASLRIGPNCGHSAQAEDSEKYLEIVHNFLKSSEIL